MHSNGKDPEQRAFHNSSRSSTNLSKSFEQLGGTWTKPQSSPSSRKCSSDTVLSTITSSLYSTTTRPTKTPPGGKPYSFNDLSSTARPRELSTEPMHTLLTKAHNPTTTGPGGTPTCSHLVLTPARADPQAQVYQQRRQRQYYRQSGNGLRNNTRPHWQTSTGANKEQALAQLATDYDAQHKAIHEQFMEIGPPQPIGHDDEPEQDGMGFTQGLATLCEAAGLEDGVDGSWCGMMVAHHPSADDSHTEVQPWHSFPTGTPPAKTHERTRQGRRCPRPALEHHLS